jgi:methyltransferase-like protein 6
MAIPLPQSCIGTRISLYLLAPKLSTPYPQEKHPSAMTAYQRIISSYKRDHGKKRSSMTDATSTSTIPTTHNKVKQVWTQEDRERIRKRVKEVEQNNEENQMNTYWKNKLENDASTNWDEFYKTHRKNFFKDRHYMEDEFSELKAIKASNTKATLLEAGCGVGNSVFPLLEAIPSLNIYCCDFSPTAIRLVGTHDSYSKSRCCTFVCDLSSKEESKIMDEKILQEHSLDDHGEGVDLAMMMFCLSAIHPDKMEIAINNVANVMKKGGVLWFRDYAENDGAQLKFDVKSRISQNFYVRGDGTRSYFFKVDELNALMGKCGLYPVNEDVRIIERVMMNRKTNNKMHRAWIHGRYQKH